MAYLRSIKVWSRRATHSFVSQGMATSLAARVVVLTLGFLIVLSASRLYGAAAVGQYAFLAGFLTFTALIVLGGAELYALRGMGPATPVQQRAQNLTVAMTRVLLGFLAILVVWFLVQMFGFGVALEERFGASVFYFLPCIVLVNALRIYLFEVCRASMRIRTYNLVLVALSASTLLAVFAFQLVPESVSFGWIVVVADVTGLVLISIVLLGNHRLPALVRVRLPYLTREVRKLRPFFVSTISTAIEHFDVFVVGLLVSSTELGIYVIARALVSIAALPRVTGSIAFAPRVAAIYSSAGRDGAISAARSQTRLIAPLACLASLVLIWLGPWLLNIFGTHGSNAYVVMLILVSVELSRGMAGQVGLVLVMCGHEGAQQLVFAVSSIVSIIGIVLFSPLGAVGGALGMLTGVVLRSIWGEALVVRALGGGVSVIPAFRSKSN